MSQDDRQEAGEEMKVQHDDDRDIDDDVDDEGQIRVEMTEEAHHQVSPDDRQEVEVEMIVQHQLQDKVEDGEYHGRKLGIISRGRDAFSIMMDSKRVFDKIKDSSKPIGARKRRRISPPTSNASGVRDRKETSIKGKLIHKYFVRHDKSS